MKRFAIITAALVVSGAVLAWLLATKEKRC